MSLLTVGVGDVNDCSLGVQFKSWVAETETEKLIKPERVNVWTCPERLLSSGLKLHLAENSNYQVPQRSSFEFFPPIWCGVAASTPPSGLICVPSLLAIKF